MSYERLAHFAMPYLILAVSLVFALTVAVAVDNKESVDQTHAALCSFTGDLQKRVATTAGILRTNPQGLAGIPPSVIRVQLHNERDTLDSLSGLDCG